MNAMRNRPALPDPKKQGLSGRRYPNRALSVDADSQRTDTFTVGEYSSVAQVSVFIDRENQNSIPQRLGNKQFLARSQRQSIRIGHVCRHHLGIAIIAYRKDLRATKPSSCTNVHFEAGRIDRAISTGREIADAPRRDRAQLGKAKFWFLE
jgi:hypothetical protein